MLRELRRFVIQMKRHLDHLDATIFGFPFTGSCTVDVQGLCPEAIRLKHQWEGKATIDGSRDLDCSLGGHFNYCHKGETMAQGGQSVAAICSPEPALDCSWGYYLD